MCHELFYLSTLAYYNLIIMKESPPEPPVSVYHIPLSGTDSSPGGSPGVTPSHPRRRTSVQSTDSRRVRSTLGSHRRNSSTCTTREEETRRRKRGVWGSDITSVFACYACIIGMFSITRFPLLVHIYKACFLVEFFLLSALFGIPFLYLQMALGQYIGTGLQGMWFISPAFKGVGVSLAMLYAVCGLYFPLPLSWLFLYFRDSFVTARDTYKWAVCTSKVWNSGCMNNNVTSPEFLGYTTAAYFHGRVLDRRPDVPVHALGDLKFEIAFNLSIIWLVVFITLSRGLRSFGKIIVILSILSMFLLSFLTIRMVEQWGAGIPKMFMIDWKAIFMDPNSWIMASREVILIWVIFAPLALHMCSHNKISCNVTQNMVCVVILISVTLLLTSCFFACTVHLLSSRGMILTASSFEEESSVAFLQSVNGNSPMINKSTAVNLVAGVILQSPGLSSLSGYQVSRMATEFFPAALAAEGVRSISPFWTITFYVMLITAGFGQQMCLWSCVIESVISIKPEKLSNWRTVITFIMCNIGFLLGLPFATDHGLQVILFADIWIGSLWWIVCLLLIMLVVVLYIRGRPFGTDQLVSIITRKEAIKSVYLPVLTFQWNVLLPLSLLVICIILLRSGHLSGFYPDAYGHFYSYWPGWVGSLQVLLQSLPLIFVGIVAIVQGFRYLLISKNQQTMHQRIELWCCPPITWITFLPREPSREETAESLSLEDDTPPKYTPPPSYSTATGRMLIKQFTNSQSTSSSVQHNIVPAESLYSAAVYNSEEEEDDVFIERPIDFPVHEHRVDILPSSPTLQASKPQAAAS